MSATLLQDNTHASIRKLIDGQLAQVDSIFRAQLQSDLPTVNHLCTHIEAYQGKMLRPMLTLLSGLAAHPQVAKTPIEDWGQLLTQSHRVIAAVTEMIHMATIVHDDVLDDAQMRRNGDTVNFLHGNEAAVLLGDYLISNAFHLCSTLGRPELNEQIGATTNELCAGELLQVHHRNNFSIDEDTYFAVIERKTASLIALCARLGAQESDASSACAQALAQFGRHLGIAFQIQDDILDLVGDEATVGKSLGQDLVKGKLTLPMIQFFTSANSAERERMLDLLGRCDDPEIASDIRTALVESGAIDQARQTAQGLVTSAQSELSKVPESPVRAVMKHLAQSVITRRF